MSSSIKIVHTADNHIGKDFSHYSGEARQRLVEERFDALEKIVMLGNEYAADFLVIAGDLFDKARVAQRDINRVVDILRKFDQTVIVLPGNHDFFENATGSLWDKFNEAAGKKNIMILSSHEPVELETGDRKVIFYPAVCQSKHSDKNMIGWVKEIEKDPEHLHIGIAHGNVEGLGLGGDQYFNMTPEELMDSGLDSWLLGHIHVPYPDKELSTDPGFFFSGTHTPDGMDNQREGYCWLLEYNEKKKVKMKQLNCSSIMFRELHYQLNSEKDIANMAKEINMLDKENTLLRLNVKGRLSEALLEEVRQQYTEWSDAFLYFEPRNEMLRLNIDKEYINGHFSENSLPHRLLSELAAGDDDLALQLAYEMVEEAKQ